MTKVHQKLPSDPRRRKQVRTFLSKYGKEGYARAGSRGGGKNSPGSFTSETARKATLIGWEKRRARAAERARLEQEENDASNV